MTATLIGRFPAGSPEWLAARANRLGGSEIAAVVGLSPYESRFSLWHRKKGTIGPVEETAPMEWGNRLEPVVAAKFCEMHPDLKPKWDGLSFVNKERDYQFASPDLLLWSYEAFKADPMGRDFNALLEVKTARYDDNWGSSGSDQIPIHYRCQVMWYADCLGLSEAHVAVLIGGSDYREYVIPYDKADALKLRAAAVEFIASLQADEQPRLDGSEATYEAVRELHPEINGEDIQVDADVAFQFLATKAAAEEAATREREAKSKLLDAMGEARFAYVGDRCIARRQPGRGGAVSLYAVDKEPADRTAA